MARVTGLVKPVTVLPLVSSAVTTGWVKAAPSPPPPGWVVKTSWVAAPALMVTLPVALAVRAPLVALSV